MSKEIPAINVIIAGHIDHGKTTLLKKLTGKWTDTHSEELKRGITIKLGYADTTVYSNNNSYNIKKEGTPLRYVSFIDAPGHEMLMATMLSGAAIVDAAILVVAANEGIKPQTKEHLMALQAKEIKDIIVVQNKIDVTTKEEAKKNYLALKEFFKNTIAENAPIIPISAQQGINIDKIYEEICKIKIPDREENAKPIFLIARSFDINKPGTTPKNLNGAVLGGTLKKGTLKVGDEIEIKPGISYKEANQIMYRTVKTKIRSLFRGSKKLDKITPGGSLAIETELDMAAGKTDALSGCVASTPQTLPEISSKVKLKYKLFPKIVTSNHETNVAELKTTETLMLSANTSVTVGTIKKLENGNVDLSLRIPIVPFKGEKVGIARNVNNHWRLIGYGEIL